MVEQEKLAGSCGFGKARSTGRKKECLSEEEMICINTEPFSKRPLRDHPDLAMSRPELASLEMVRDHIEPCSADKDVNQDMSFCESPDVGLTELETGCPDRRADSLSPAC